MTFDLVFASHNVVGSSDNIHASHGLDLVDFKEIAGKTEATLVVSRDLFLPEVSYNKKS